MVIHNPYNLSHASFPDSPVVNELDKYLPLPYRRSRSSQPHTRRALNRAQRVVLALGLLVISFFGLYVPYVSQTHVAEVATSAFLFNQTRGYAPVWDLPQDGLIFKAPTTSNLFTVSIDYRRIFFTWTVIACVTGAVIVLLGFVEPRSKAERTAGV